jgi:flagellar biosynthesis/type III secretory pathway protein FliH
MLVDRVGTVRRKEEMTPLSKEYFEQVGLKIPESLATLLSEGIGVLMERFKLGEDEQEELSGYIKKKEYGAMFETLVERHWQLKDEGRAEGLEEGFTIGLTKGRAQERKWAREGVRKLKQMGISPDIIAAGFGLSLEEIEKL